MSNNKDNKPEQDPFFQFYIVWPIIHTVESATQFFKAAWRWITGAWWCEHCDNYHDRRVHRYALGGDSDYLVCSIGLAHHQHDATSMKASYRCRCRCRTKRKRYNRRY